MGRSRTGDRLHLISLPSPDVSSFCGIDVVDVLVNWNTGEPVAFATHWEISQSVCVNCLEILDRSGIVWE